MYKDGLDMVAATVPEQVSNDLILPQRCAKQDSQIKQLGVEQFTDKERWRSIYILSLDTYLNTQGLQENVSSILHLRPAPLPRVYPVGLVYHRRHLLSL